MATNIRLLYVTCPDAEVASTISRKLLENGFIACANILPGMESLYWWEGKITRSQEVVLILKTTLERQSQVMAQVEALHPYDTPCILAIPVEEGNEPYLRWLKGALY